MGSRHDSNTDDDELPAGRMDMAHDVSNEDLLEISCL